MYIFCPVNKSVDIDGSRPLIVPHEYIQPIEVTILESSILNTDTYHKLYNLIQNTRHEFSLDNEELNNIRALEILWPLLKSKKIIRVLEKLLISSDTTCTNFFNGVFTDENPS